MKAKLTLCAAAAALLAGCQVEVAPVGVAVAPVPVVEVVPTIYVWDGVEYVGDYNGQFMYFGPGGAWVVCDPIVLGRFHDWERYHSDWRVHAIRNDREHRLDRDHHPEGFKGPARDSRVPEQARRDSAQKTPAPAKKAPAPAKKAPPPRKKEEKPN